MERITLAADVTAALERARIQVEALAQTADELQNVLPEAVGTALSEGLRTEAAPLARRLAEVKGLANGTIRRLERLEADLLAERHARVDDLALLVDLVTGGWRAINERLDRIEAAVAPREGQLVELRAAEPRCPPSARGKNQLEARPAADLALEVDPAAERRRELLRDREPESGAAAGRRHERAEEALLRLHGNS